MLHARYFCTHNTNSLLKTAASGLTSSRIQHHGLLSSIVKENSDPDVRQGAGCGSRATAAHTGVKRKASAEFVTKKMHDAKVAKWTGGLRMAATGANCDDFSYNMFKNVTASSQNEHNHHHNGLMPTSHDEFQSGGEICLPQGTESVMSKYQAMLAQYSALYNSGYLKQQTAFKDLVSSYLLSYMQSQPGSKEPIVPGDFSHRATDSLHVSNLTAMSDIDDSVEAKHRHFLPSPTSSYITSSDSTRQATLNQISTNEESVMKRPAALPITATAELLTSSATQNWCVKCGINFKLTSDLVYHMRTFHKKETSASAATSPKVKEKRSNVGGVGAVSAHEEEGQFCVPGELLKLSPFKLATLKFTASCGGRSSSPLAVAKDSLKGSDPNREVKKLKCEICNEVFKEKHHLSRHMTSHR
jgi:hypothetical protein